jgi:hypothetical protein
MNMVLLLSIFILASCSSNRGIIRSPSSHSSKYESLQAGTIITLREPVVGAKKEESIFKDKNCEIFKYCKFEKSQTETIQGSFKVVEINNDEEKLVLLSQKNEKLQLDCGLKYIISQITLENDQYCAELMHSYKIFTFPEFMQTIIDIEITYLDPLK